MTGRSVPNAVGRVVVRVVAVVLTGPNSTRPVPSADCQAPSRLIVTDARLTVVVIVRRVTQSAPFVEVRNSRFTPSCSSLTHLCRVSSKVAVVSLTAPLATSRIRRLPASRAITIRFSGLAEAVA